MPTKLSRMSLPGKTGSLFLGGHGQIDAEMTQKDVDDPALFLLPRNV